MSPSNETRRRAAESAARPTYAHDVIETWPACTTCATPIRRPVDPPHGVRAVGLFRGCGCPGVAWRMLFGRTRAGPDGWVQHLEPNGDWERLEAASG